MAQAAISTEDMRSLTEWFSDLHKKPRMWCDDPWQKNVTGVGTASNQEMFSALLIVLAAHVCREKSSEDELWAAVASVLERISMAFTAVRR